MRRAGAVAALMCAAFTMMTSAAMAGPAEPYCTDWEKLLGCTPPRAPYQPEPVDPGGSETQAVPVPLAGRAFGFSANMDKESSFTPAMETDTIARAGASAHRLVVNWKWLQYRESDPPVPTSYEGDDGQNLRHLDERYAAMVAAGITPVIHVSKAPFWASRFASCRVQDMTCQREAKKAADWGQDGYYFPDYQHREDLKRLHRALARRYPLAQFEGWNEPNLYYDSPPERAFEPWAPGPEEMRDIQCAAYWGVKEVDRSRRFIGPSFVYRSWAHFADYVNRIFAAGGPYCWDGYNTHAYVDGSTDFGENSWFAKIMAGARRMKTHWGDRDPIWITEAGWPTTTQTWWGEPWLLPSAHADAATRLYNRVMTMPDVGGLFFHTLRDTPGGDPGVKYDNFGFLAGDLTPKPAFCVFARRAARAYPGC